MKLNLRPGVTPAIFWTTVGVGLGGTTISALGLTAYGWAPLVIAILALIVRYFSGQTSQVATPPLPPAALAQDTAPEGRGDERRPPPN